VESLAGRLPCLGVLSGVLSITVEDGVAGEQPIAMETVHPVAMRILAGFFKFFFPSLPLLLRDLGIDPGTCSSHV